MAEPRKIDIFGESFLVSIKPFTDTKTRWDVSFHNMTVGTKDQDEMIRVNATSEDEALKAAEPQFRVKLSEKRGRIQKAKHADPSAPDDRS